MKYTTNDINKMKVFELRKLVSDNGIFKGGLSSLKKADIIDKIYLSDWWRLNQGKLSEKEAIEKRLAELQKKLEEQKLQEEQKPVIESEPVIEQTQETPESEPVIEQTQETPEQEQKQEINIDEIVQKALQQQREDFLKRIFG